MNNGFLKHPKVGKSVRESGSHGIDGPSQTVSKVAGHGQAAIARVMVRREERRPGDGRGDSETTMGPIV